MLAPSHCEMRGWHNFSPSCFLNEYILKKKKKAPKTSKSEVLFHHGLRRLAFAASKSTWGQVIPNRCPSHGASTGAARPVRMPFAAETLQEVSFLLNRPPVAHSSPRWRRRWGPRPDVRPHVPRLPGCAGAESQLIGPRAPPART